jgi:ribosome-associated protein
LRLIDPKEQHELAELVAETLDEKKGQDIVLLDVSELLWITDTFVIVSGGSNRQVQTLAEAVEERLKAEGVRPLRIEGKREAEWVLLDYGDVVVHVFQPATRDYYALERLWGDAPRVEWEPATSEA